MTSTPKAKENANSTNLLEYVYCEIKFGTEIAVWDKAPGYHYISEFENIQPGDVVVVPTSWGEKLGVVKTVIRCTEADAPWPVFGTKKVLRFAYEEEIWTGRVLDYKGPYSDSTETGFEAACIDEASPGTYLDQKRRLINLIQHLQSKNRLSEELDLSRFIPAFAESADSLSGGTYYGYENLYILRTRIMTRKSVNSPTKNVWIGQELGYRVEEMLFITDSAENDVGRLSKEGESVILPLIRSESADIELIAVSHVNPLYVDISIRLSGVEMEATSELVLNGSDWKEEAEEIKTISTTIPLSVGQKVFQIWSLYCESDAPMEFSEFWETELANDQENYELVKIYLENWAPEDKDVLNIYDLFSQYAFDELIGYWHEGNEVGYDVWASMQSFGFYHWNQSIGLVDPITGKQVCRVDLG